MQMEYIRSNRKSETMQSLLRTSILLLLCGAMTLADVIAARALPTTTPAVTQTDADPGLHAGEAGAENQEVELFPRYGCVRIEHWGNRLLAQWRRNRLYTSPRVATSDAALVSACSPGSGRWNDGRL